MNNRQMVEWLRQRSSQTFGDDSLTLSLIARTLEEYDAEPPWDTIVRKLDELLILGKRPG